MKKLFTLFITASTLFLATSSGVLQSTGIAGYTGSPGETSCSNCHGGGSSAASGVSITAVPSFSLNEYMPDSTYQLAITVEAAGFTMFGFGCEILDSLNQDAGNMQNNGPGVKFMIATKNGRKNATHTGIKTGSLVTFNFDWTAPSSGRATFYVAANAVNGNNNFQGDFPLPPVSLTLRPAKQAADTSVIDVGIGENMSHAKKARVFPNPASGSVHLAYTLTGSTAISFELADVDGKTLRKFPAEKKEPGEHLKRISLENIPEGLYLIKANASGKVFFQKRLIVR
jgi:hypothetical protein